MGDCLDRDKEIPYYKVSDEYGKLQAVYAVKYTFEDEPEMIAAVKFVFENGTVYNEALPEFDEISFRDHLILDDYDTTEDVSAISPWNTIIGSKVLWIWEMRNQQGYYDGMQYSFRSDDNEVKIVQFMVFASTIKVYWIEK